MELQTCSEYMEVCQQSLHCASLTTKFSCTNGWTKEVLNDPKLKPTQVKDVRWLSHEKAISNLRRCLSSVITSLERSAEEWNCAQAAGLVGFIEQ